MKYQGGKYRTCARISGILESLRQPGMTAIDAFCGALHIVSSMSGERIAFDRNQYLICTYRAMQRGWRPPERECTHKQWEKLREDMDEENPMTGFVLTQQTMFGGFNRSFFTSQKNWNSGRRNLISRIEQCVGVEFLALSYEDFWCDNSLVFCDPPYRGTEQYLYDRRDGRKMEKFDSDAFWQHCRELAESNIVVVSEVSCPDDFVEIAAFQQGVAMRGTSSVTHERIYMTEKQALQHGALSKKEKRNGRR